VSIVWPSEVQKEVARRLTMKIHRAHKIRLCPNNKQANYFARACGCARFAYNWGLSEWQKQYKAGEKPTPYGLKKYFNAIKKKEFPWISEVTKCAPEGAFVNLGKAFQGFFQNVKAGKKPGYPRFKKKGKKDSFYIANDKVQFDGKRVRIPKLGWVGIREALRFDGKILSATVSKTAGMWFLSVNVESEVPDPIANGPVLGVDVGIKALAVASDGREFENPKALRAGQSRIRLLQKSVSRKQKGSQNRKKAIHKLQRQHYRVSCIRKDAIHKATTTITKSCSVLGIESLNVQGMLRNHKLAGALSDASLSEFHRQIEYKSRWNGVSVVRADPFYPSSKTCSACGSIKADLKLSDRTYECACGFKIDRDLNAALNLRDLAVGSTVAAYRLGSAGLAVRRAETADWVGISRETVKQFQ
jgi:putative transposase